MKIRYYISEAKSVYSKLGVVDVGEDGELVLEFGSNTPELRKEWDTFEEAEAVLSRFAEVDQEAAEALTVYRYITY